MFGQQDNQQPNDQQIPEHTIEGALQDDHSQGATQSQQNQPGDWGHPGVPIDTPAPQSVQPSNDSPSLQNDTQHAEPQQPVNNDLLAIKQKALTQLSPIVGQLDQSPEEKFRTTMMMIQASDDQNLISAAYEAANAIPDEKAKAQALLDIVNEINYFTQHHNQ
jgi:hypothetical protein